MTTRSLDELIKKLPPELQQEVYDFAQFLLDTKVKRKRKGFAQIGPEL